jgi:hypothetical protein
VRATSHPTGVDVGGGKMGSGVPVGTIGVDVGNGFGFGVGVGLGGTGVKVGSARVGIGVGGLVGGTYGVLVGYT